MILIPAVMGLKSEGFVNHTLNKASTKQLCALLPELHTLDEQTNALNDVRKAENVQQNATEEVRDLEGVNYGRSFEELSLLSLDTRSLWEEVMTASKCVKCCYEEERNMMLPAPTEKKIQE